MQDRASQHPDSSDAIVSDAMVSDAIASDTASSALIDVLERIPNTFFAWMRADGLVTRVSPSVENVLGLTGAEYAAQVVELIHPEDRRAAGGAAGAVRDDPSRGATVAIRIRGADGNWRIFDAHVVNALDDPDVEAIVWMLTDKTDRYREESLVRAEEERFRLMVEYSYDLYLVIDDDFEIAWANQRLTSMTGYSHDEVVGRPIIDYVHHDDVAQIQVELQKLLDADATYETITLRARCADGSWIWVEVVGLHRVDEDIDEVVPRQLLGGSLICVRDITTRRKERLALESAEQRFRALVENSGDVILLLDDEFTVTYTSPSMLTVFGYPPEEITTTNGIKWVHPEDMVRLATILDNLLAVSGRQHFDMCRVRRADGQWRWAEVTITSYLDDPAVRGIVANLRDVTVRVEAEQAARRLLDIFETTNDYVVVLSATGEILHLNAAGRQILGVDPSGPVPATPDDGLLAPHEIDRLTTTIYEILDKTDSWNGEFELQMADGSTTPMLTQVMAHRGEDGEVEFHSVSMRDMSDRKEFEARLAHQATHDALTGLPNRTLLIDRLSVAVAHARRRRTTVGVLFLDLDHFKIINDSRGHSTGDALLKEISERLATTLRPDDTVARFGGDEFVVLCNELSDPAEAVAVGERIEEIFTRPFILDGTEVFISVSIGISFLDKTTSDADQKVTPTAVAEQLIREADAAMYRAKDRGRSQMAIFDESLRATTIQRLELDTALRYALDRDEFVVHYQPIFDLKTGKVSGVEALVRWQHPKYGLLTPDNFIPLAEDTGMIIPLGRIVLEKACRQIVEWQSVHSQLAPLSLAVNISGRQLAHPTLIPDLERVISSSGIDPSHLDLEITESLLMDDVEFSFETLTKLKRLEVNIAVDDFGTGYSSLSYLRSFPVDYLKIDRSFVSGLSQHHGDEAIVIAIIGLAKTLGLMTVAEGVETSDQLTRLRQHGCDFAQGFHLSIPLPPEHIHEILGTSAEIPRFT